MSIEFLTDLENKVESLITLVTRLRQENADLKLELELVNTQNTQTETANEKLKQEIAALKADCDGRDQKIVATSEKIQGLIAKLESVA